MATRSSEVEISTVRKKCKGGHKIGYCSSWKEDYPYLQDLAFNNTLKDLFPQLSRLASIALIIPVSKAECERCFSSMNPNKN